jgi:DME family drug/metabolite transporter
MAAYQPLFFAAVHQTGVAIGTVLAIGSAPILTSLLARYWRGDQLNPRWGIATAVSITGVTVLVLGEQSIRLEIQGVFLAIAAGASYATYAVASKRLVATHNPTGVQAIVFAGAALLISPVLFVAELQWVLQPAGAATVLHLGLIATALAYLLFSHGLTHISVSNAVTLTLAEPLTAVVLGLALLGEKLTSTGVVGGGLVLVGLGILSARINSETTREMSGN